jgi:hypothetical protein
MIAHKEPIATSHMVSAVTVAHADLSATQAIDQVRTDMSNQWQQTASGSNLPNTGPYHAGQGAVLRGGNDPGNGGADPSKRGDNSAASLDSLSSAVDALRNSVLNDLDPTKNHDPTKGNSLDDLIGGGRSLEDLKGALESSGFSTGETGGSSGKGGDLHPGNNREESMLGADTTTSGTSLAPVTNNDEGVHAADGGKTAKDFGDGTLGKAAAGIVSPPGPAHDQMQYAMDEIKSDSGRSATNNSAAPKDHTSSDGKVSSHRNDDGSTTVNDYSNGTTTTLNKDGSSTTSKIDSNGNIVPGSTTTTPAPSIPDEDHQSAPVEPHFAKLMQEAIKSEHPPSHENDNKDIVDSDIPGTVSVSDVRTTTVVDTKATLLTDNRNGPDGLTDGGHGGGGGVASDPNKPTLDFGGPDYAPTPQSNGPEERTHPAVKTDPTGGSHGGQQSTGGGQSGSDSHHVSPIGTAVETTAQHLAHEVQDAYNATHPDQSSKTAQSVDGVHTGHDIASVLGSTVSGHDNGGFADLIRLAQNPALSGLVPPPVAAAHDAISALQLSALGDLAGHAGDVHHIDDVHAALAHPAAVHEDVSHVTAAVIDHGHH